MAAVIHLTVTRAVIDGVIGTTILHAPTSAVNNAAISTNCVALIGVNDRSVFSIKRYLADHWFAENQIIGAWRRGFLGYVNLGCIYARLCNGQPSIYDAPFKSML